MSVFGKEYSMVYDHLYRDKEYGKECDFIETVFSKYSSKVKTILDLGCGTGSHALILAKRGYHLVGVDHSKEMFNIAKVKAKDLDINVEFIEGDITDIDINQEFDAVISMFDVMSYQITNSAIAGLCNVAKKHLISGGIFLFDCWNGMAVLRDRPADNIKEVRLNNREKIVRFNKPVLNILNHNVENRFKVLKIKDEDLISETHESHFMRFFFPQEIKYYLEVAGFKAVEFCPFLKLGETLTEYDWKMAVIGTY